MKAVNYRKYFFVAISCGISIFVFFFVVRTFFYGETVVVIDNEYNPLTTEVLLDDTKLFPTGKNGSLYNFSGRTGDYQLTIVGPFLETITETISVEPLETLSNSFTLQQKTITSITEEAVELDVGFSITKMINYGEKDDWIIVKTESSTSLKRPVHYVLRYNAGTWVVIEKADKINSSDNKFIDAPEELIDYINTEAAD